MKCWGDNLFGELGDNTNALSRATAADVVGLTSGVAAVTTGNFAKHTCVLTTAGGIKCWGDGSLGQLGENNPTIRRAPVDVLGLTSGVIQVSAGGNHTCASQ